MKTQDQLYLVLAKEWFTQILEGRKHEEYRAFTDFYISRLCVVDENGKIVDTKKYKTVKFQQGYQKKAPQIIVEVTDIFIENDEDVHPENGDFLTTDNCNFVIELGKIISKTNC
ncbi:MAG: hypothetical protein BGO40_05665 [Chryseobacterium sp. 39-10]|nr:hypothetical protein [Chryseobacterium sp.]ODU59391.1 MAG: hypothetical protein ABT12_01365 [Paludibacter sp. SCN 51-9]OJV47294.1 MAG: hypothetical protein BGO40_05665 [Chryseobacterium sp. 39-10]